MFPVPAWPSASKWRISVQRAEEVTDLFSPLGRMMRGEGQNLMRTTMNTSASAGLCYALLSLLGTLYVLVLWLGQHGMGAVADAC